MKHKKLLLASPLLFIAMAAQAQEEDSITREIELGALFTSGNTDEETLNFAAALLIDREDWNYGFTLDGLYASSDGEVKGQRIVAVASANYEITDYSFFQSRFSHEDDRFSGFDSQSNLTFSYGREFLRGVENMELTTNTGIGMRYSRLEDGTDREEPILRLAGEYEWTLSDTAVFSQDLSAEAGSNSTIYRSLTGIETQIMENLSLRFSVKVKHQTEVPINRENTDTETAVTFVMTF